MKKTGFILCLFLMLCFSCIQVFAQDERADYTCIGRFVQGSDEEYWLIDEQYEYLPELLKDTRIYRFQYITGHADYCPSEYEFTVKTDIYINIIMEKAYFDEYFNYEDPFSIKLRAAGQSIDMEVEENIIRNIQLLTLYDAEQNIYLTSQALAGADLDNGELFHGMGYLEQFVEDYDLLPELLPDAGIYKFHILHSTDFITKNYIFVICSKDFYEQKKEQNMGIEIFYIYNYGFQYKGQSLWSLMDLSTQDYCTLRGYDLDVMKSWLKKDTVSDTDGVQTGVEDAITGETDYFSWDKIFAGIIVLVLGEILYLWIKKRKKNR